MRRASLLFTLLACPALPEPTAATIEPRPARLHVIVSSHAFMRVNPSDAVAAMKVLGRQIGRSNRFQFDMKMDATGSIEQMRRRLRENSVDLLVLDGVDYLMLADSGLIEAVLTVSRDGKPGAREYLLLVSGDTPGEGIRDLRGAKIAVCSRTSSHTGLMWIETYLAAHRLGRVNDYFSQVQIVDKVSQCVLPLFFRKIDACVVDDGGFDIVRDLNPQLNRLRVVARSAPVVEGFMVMPIRPHPYRKELIEAISTGTRTSGGSQIMTMFRSGPPLPSAPHHYATLRDLFQRYCRLTGRSTPPAESLGATGP